MLYVLIIATVAFVAGVLVFRKNKVTGESLIGKIKGKLGIK